MRKKFTMLLMSLLAFVGVAKAGVTDFPAMSEGENIKWYTISNTRSASGKYLYWTESGVKDSNERTGASFFYVTGSAEACYIHNYATNLLFSGDGAWTKDGVACKLTVSPLNTGLMIGFNSTYLNEKNYDNGFTTWGDINDAGSVFVFEEVTDFSAIIDVPAAKNAAIAELNNLATVSVIYSAAVTSAVNEINAVTPASNGLKDLNDAVEAINAVVANYRNAAYQALAGKYFTIETLTEARANGFMQMSTSSVVGTKEATSPANIWQFVYNNGAVNVFNPYTGKYLCEPGDNSTNIAVTTEQASAGAYQLNINAAAEVADAKVKLTSNGKSVHMAGGFTLVRWDNGAASEWQVVEVEDFSNIISLYKAASTTTLDSWATLSVVFDAALIEAAEAAIGGIATTDWATFAAIDAELKKVTDKVAEKYFTFKNDDKATAARVDAYLAANASDKKGYGTKTFDYSAIWRLLSAGGTSFYLYNELNDVYLKNPGSGDLVADAAQAATYTFEIVDAATNKAELKSGNETLHLSNACALMSYDNNDPASRWYIATYDYKADLNALLESVNEGDYADVPALGQYPTAAYNALVEANENATTVVEVAEAIAAFKAAKNLPVFTIDGVKDYAVGKSVYDDQDGAPNFKATNVYDKTMWWVFDQTKETIGVTESVNVVNYATRKGFWGAEALKIAETSDAVEGEDDGIYLFYTVGNGTPLHYQNDNQVIVRWSSTESTSGSATRFTHIGNTYDLDKLTDDKIAALKELENTFNAKAYLVSAQVGPGAGQYQGDLTAFNEKFTAVDQFLTYSTLTAKATLTVNEINQLKNDIETLAAALVLNTPVNGTYFRIQGANSEVTPAGWYITGHTNADGGRIALNSEADASTIYYYNEGKLQAYVSREFIALNSGHYTFADETHPATEITFAASPRVAGAYTIKSGDRYLHYKVYNGNVEIDRCEQDIHADHDWFLVEIKAEDLPAAFDIVYNFKFEGDVKYTQTTPLALGDNYPAVSIELPYGVSLKDATTPEGTVDGAKTFDFDLSVDKALPFETAVDAAGITKWYYMQMHVFNASYLNYIQDCDTYVEWADNNVTDEEIDSHLWGFVGNIWDGIQVVNKATEKAIVSTGSGDATMGDAGTVFMPTHSANAGNADYFCLQHASGNYLNAQGDRIKHYGQNDNGSTFFVTEAGKEFSVTVNAEAGYSTYYSNYRLAIPETVKAYIIDKVDGKSINLTQVEGVLPANTGVILEGAGTHTFVISAAQTADVSDNLLKGTAAKTLITAEENTNYYVLANKDKGVGLYKAALNKDANGDNVAENGVAFHNGANKAYLPVVVDPAEDAAEAPAMFSFGRGEGTTSIENAELATDNAELVIYDLTGRRVEKMVKGVYIVNGKKVLVK